MKKLFLFSFLVLSTASFTYDRNAILNAIIESDYNSFFSNYNAEKISDDERKQFITMNDQVITLRQKWVVAHYIWPQFGKDLFISYIASLASGIGLQVLGNSIIRSNLDGIIVGLAATCVGGYFGVIKYMDAFQMPKKLFANAMKIKDALLNNN